MKKLLFLCLLMILGGCSTQNKFSDFDYSFARSGGISPSYENLLIRGDQAFYSFKAPGKKIKKDFQVSTKDLENIEKVLTENQFRKIEEDLNKLFDQVKVEITVKNGDNSGRKSDASLIRKKDQQNWMNVVAEFQRIIDENIKNNSVQ
jgi:pyrrolidone-carboxylate peptidase